MVSVIVTLLCLLAYLCVCSVSVGSGGVVLVPEKGLQLSDVAVQSGDLGQRGTRSPH